MYNNNKIYIIKSKIFFLVSAIIDMGFPERYELRSNLALFGWVKHSRLIAGQLVCHASL